LTKKREGEIVSCKGLMFVPVGWVCDELGACCIKWKRQSAGVQRSDLKLGLGFGRNLFARPKIMFLKLRVLTLQGATVVASRVVVKVGAGRLALRGGPLHALVKANSGDQPRKKPVGRHSTQHSPCHQPSRGGGNIKKV